MRWMRHGKGSASLVRAGGTRCYIRFDTNDGLDALVRGLPPEIERAEKISVVRGGKCRHAQAFGFIEQLTQAGRSIQHGVLGVGVQVDERIIAGSHRTILIAGPDGVRQARPDSSTSRANARSCG
jgi:hypothetical protein